MTEPAKTETLAVVKREPIIVSNPVPVLDTGLFEQMQRVARVMATTALVPEHLNRLRKSGQQVIPISPDEAVANCFLVVNQAVRWQMDPFAVAQATFVQRGKIGYEGKLIAGVVNSSPALARRLSYRYQGDGAKRSVIVSGRLKGEAEDREIEGTLSSWATENEQWKRAPDQMLAYRGAREWARRHLPEAILGVLADDDLDVIEATATRVEASTPPTGTAALRAAAEKASQATPEPPQAVEEAPTLPTEDGSPASDDVVPPNPWVLADWVATLAEAASTKELEDLTDAAPSDIRAHPDYTAAVEKRRKALASREERIAQTSSPAARSRRSP